GRRSHFDHSDRVTLRSGKNKSFQSMPLAARSLLEQIYNHTVTLSPSVIVSPMQGGAPMAVMKYPWVAPGTTPDEAQAIAERIAGRRQRRDHVISAGIEDD